MKKIYLIFATSFLMAIGSFAQVGINTDSSQPDPSAMLEIKSTTKGLLPPRMTMAQRDAIVNPADGLMVFCTDCNSSNYIWCYVSGKWYTLTFNRCPIATNVTQTGNAGIGQILTGTYTYSDPDNDPQGTSIFKWYHADNSSGLNEVQIAGASNLSYTTTLNDTTKYVRFSVTPVAQTGATPGDEVKSATYIGPIVNCGQPIIDSRDGKSYNTVLIGTQCWMAQNLNVGIRINGSVYQTDNSIIEKYCFYDLETNCTIYGGGYEWGEMMNYTASSNSNPSGRQGICPSGWHIPSDAEWCQLLSYLDINMICNTGGYSGIDVGGKMKEIGFTHWSSPNSGATNSSGFTALPNGTIRPPAGSDVDLGKDADWWSSTEFISGYAWFIVTKYNVATAGMNHVEKDYGWGVRCVKN